LELFGISYFPALVAALAAVFGAREFVTSRNLITLKYLFTPMVTALIAGFVILSISEDGASAYRTLVLVALLCSLVADTLLMVVEVDLMKNGIVYFMLTHAMYIAAFSLSYEFHRWNLVLAGVLVFLLLLFSRGMKSSAGKMKSLILIYAVVLCAMLFFALTQFNAEVSRREILMIIGAVMFVASDFLLAYLTFIKPHRQESVIVWAVYAPAQFLIALSCFS
jgi:uncharacterized membrane protein YhhN